MLWATIFLIVAIVAGLFALGSISGVALALAKALFFIFAALFVISLIIGATRFRLTHRH